MRGEARKDVDVGWKHSDLNMRSDVFVQNITMHYKCLLLFLYC